MNTNNNKWAKASTKQHTAQCTMQKRATALAATAAATLNTYTQTHTSVNFKVKFLLLKNQELPRVRLYFRVYCADCTPVFDCLLAHSLVAFCHFIRSAECICDFNLCTCILFNKNYHIISYSEWIKKTTTTNKYTKISAKERKLFSFFLLFVFFSLCSAEVWWVFVLSFVFIV